MDVLRPPPPIARALHSPATAGTMLLSLGATLAWWAGVDCSPLFADAHVARGHLHRLLTSALLHADPIHLAFNFYWLWRFGTLIERHVGSAKTFALFALLAGGSNAAEHALLTGGVGLSGIVYGLFGMLWLFWKRGRAGRFAGAVDQKIEAIFVTWFFACVLLTVSGILPAANIAHAVGALLGVLIGWAMLIHAPRQKRFAPLGIVLLALLFAATVARPHVNLSPRRGQQEASLGYIALNDNRDRDALRWSRHATAMNPRIASWWFNRGIAHARLEEHDAALAAYNNAARLDPSNRTYRAARDELQNYLAGATLAITDVR